MMAAAIKSRCLVGQPPRIVAERLSAATGDPD
jgi:hypothetical protein